MFCCLRSVIFCVLAFLHGEEAVHLIAEHATHVSRGIEVKHLRRCLANYSKGLNAVKPGLGNHFKSHPLTVVATSPRNIVFGAGSGSTGTFQFYKAFTNMGFKAHAKSYGNSTAVRNFLTSLVQILNESPKQCFKKIRNFNYSMLPEIDAVFDFPIPELFIDFFVSFPKAKWILSTRSSHDWAIARRTVQAFNKKPAIQEPCGKRFNKFSLEQNAVMFDLMNELIKCAVPPENILEVNIYTNHSNQTQGLMLRIGKFIKFHQAPPLEALFPSNIVH